MRPPIVDDTVAIWVGEAMSTPLNVGLLATLVALDTASTVTESCCAVDADVVSADAVCWPSAVSDTFCSFPPHDASNNAAISNVGYIFMLSNCFYSEYNSSSTAVTLYSCTASIYCLRMSREVFRLCTSSAISVSLSSYSNTALRCSSSASCKAAST